MKKYKIPVNEPYLFGNEKKYLTKCLNDGYISSSGQYLVSGYPFWSTNSGRIYIYVRTGNGWSYSQEITNPSGGNNCKFGHDVSFTQDAKYLAVGEIKIHKVRIYERSIYNHILSCTYSSLFWKNK